MLPEYLKYWGLSRPPFSLTPDPEMLYMSRQHQEGLIRLKYAVVSNKGGALLISENAGDGKTSLLARLRTELAQYYRGNCRVVFIDHPTLTANQMVGEIARQLGVGTATTDKLAVLNALRSFLLESHEQGEKCVVMLDEGQMLCHRPDLLQELRILLNFCVSDAFLLTFILSGQKPLDGAIRAMPEFYQRLPVRFFLRNLDMDDTRELIRYRLQVAGCEPGRDIFGEDGYAGIFNHSKGCPRVICSVADLSLVIAHSRFADKVDFVSVSQATSDMNRTDGAYHYYHFLKSFQEPEAASGKQTGLSRLPEASCPACTGEVTPEAVFCLHCGYALKDKPVAESAVQEAAIEPPAQAEPAEPGPAEQDPPPERGHPVAGAGEVTEPSGTAMFSFDEGSGEAPVENPQRAIRFVLEGESDKPAPAQAGPEQMDGQPAADNPAEENAGLEPDPAEKKIAEKQPEILTAEDVECKRDGGEVQTEHGTESFAGQGEEPEPGQALEPETIKCGFCGLELVQETLECPNCGETLSKGPAVVSEEDDAREYAAEEQALERDFQQPAPEEQLLAGLKDLKLEEHMMAGRQSPARGNGELLRLPRRFRFFGRSPVVQFVARDAGDFFTSRCGVRIGRDEIRFEMDGDTNSLAYGMVEQVRTDTVSNQGAVLLSQLVITATDGTYRLTLPFKADTGGRLAALLQNYIGGRLPAAAGNTA